MRISVITISYNQSRFLRECIESVRQQDYHDIEHIIVDPGSTDGSLEIISSYGNELVSILKPDDGPADGLNKGFCQASGDVFFYLNSDDMVLPGAFSSAVELLKKTGADVVHGHAHIIDENGQFKRLVYSDKFNLHAVGYRACILIQPSAFFTRDIFERTGGFNTNNTTNWDGELFIDMALANANFVMSNQVWSAYRVYGESITGSGRLAALHEDYAKCMYEKIFNKPVCDKSNTLQTLFRLRRHILNYRDTWQRVIHGPVFASQEKI